MSSTFDVPAFRRGWPPFRVCGVIGLMLAIACGLSLTIAGGLSVRVLGVIVAAAVATFLSLAMATQVVTGSERLVYYHHEIAILAVVAVCVRALGQPVLPYVDVTAIAIGAFLACGRIGCLLAGCCFGRPWRFGIRYRDGHGHRGFPETYVGVTLFPIQALESAFVFAVVALGIALKLAGSAPGDVLGWYVVAYGVGRFFFEFLRGDPHRPYWLGFSEAQWTSLVLMCGGVAAEGAGILPRHPSHVMATAGLAAAMGSIGWRRQVAGAQTSRLMCPRHVKEIADIVRRMGRAPRHGAITPACTTLGLCISVDRLRSGVQIVDVCTLSLRNGRLSPTAVQAIADLIVALAAMPAEADVATRDGNVFHVLIRYDRDGQPASARAFREAHIA